MADFQQWLEELNMPQYASSLIQNGVTSPADVAPMCDEQLEAAGVFLRGHRKRMLTAAQKYGLTPENTATMPRAYGNEAAPIPPPKKRGMPTALERHISRQDPNRAVGVTPEARLLPSMGSGISEMYDGAVASSTESLSAVMSIEDLDTFLAEASGDNATAKSNSFDFSKHQTDMLNDGDLDLDALMEDLSALETDTAIFQEATVDAARMGGIGGRMSYISTQRDMPDGMVGGSALALVGTVEGNSYTGGSAAYGNIVLGPDQNAGVGEEPPTYEPYASKYIGKTHAEIEKATLVLFKDKIEVTKTAHERLAQQADALASASNNGPSAADTAAASSGLSELAIAKGNYKGLTNEQKFAMAMKKMELATGLQTVVIKVSNFEGSMVSIPINTSTTARMLLGTLVKKFDMPADSKYCLFEVIPSLRMERLVEDHENVFEINKCWGFTVNKFVCGISSFKPIRYNSDHWNLEWGPIGASAPIPLPPVEGLIYWATGNDKGKKLKWRPNFFVVRDSGFWISKDYKKDKNASLAKFVDFENYFCYIGMKPRELLGCNSDFCICFKPKKDFSPGRVKYMAMPSQEQMMKWIITARVGIFKGDVLSRNEMFYVEGQIIGSEEQSIYEATEKANHGSQPSLRPIMPMPKSRPTQPVMPRPDANSTSNMPTSSPSAPIPSVRTPRSPKPLYGNNPSLPKKGGDGPATPPKLAPKPVSPRRNNPQEFQPALPAKGKKY